MTVRFKISATIFDCLPDVINWLVNKRNNEDDTINENTKAGINFSIIVNSACFIEGALESGLSSILSYQVRSKNVNDQLIIRLSEDLENRIRTTTGSTNYNSLFELLLGLKFSDLQPLTHLWEGIAILFHLRNVLAHGRAINFSMEFPGEDFPPDFNSFWNEEFKGGYKKVQDYLIKKQIVDKRFMEQSWELFFLQDDIANHFWSIALNFILGIGNALSDDVQQAFKSATLYENLLKFKQDQ